MGPLLSSLLALQSPLRAPSPRRPSPPPWPGAVAGLSEALMPTLESSPTRSCWPVESVAASCAEDPSLAPTRSSLPDIAVTVCLHPSWELRLEATTSTRTIRTRLLSPCLTLACTRTTTAGTSTTTFACSLSRAQSAWDPTLEQLACPPAWKSTPRAPSALFPDGEPPLRVAASPVFSRRSTSLSCLTTTAVTPPDRTTSLTP